MRLFVLSLLLLATPAMAEDPLLQISGGFRDPIPEDFTDPTVPYDARVEAGLADITGEKQQWEGEHGRSQYAADIVTIQTRADTCNNNAIGTDVQGAVGFEYGVISGNLNTAADKLSGWGFSDCDFCHDMMCGFLDEANDHNDAEEFQEAFEALESAYEWLEARQRMEGGYITSTGQYVNGVLDHMTLAYGHLETAEMTLTEWQQMQQQ